MNTAGAWRCHPWHEGRVGAAVTAATAEGVLSPTMVCIGRALGASETLEVTPCQGQGHLSQDRLFQALPDLATEKCHLLLKGHRIPLSCPTSLTEK